jgi:hypothetical protein
MRDLVSHGIEVFFLLVSGEVLISLNIVVVVSDAADVFHGAHCVIWAHNGIQFVERIWLVEHLLVVADGGLGHTEPVILHLLSVLGQRLTTEEPHGHVGKLSSTLRTR